MKSRACAQAIEKRVKAIGQQSRGIKTNGFGWTRLVNYPAVLLEGFFVDSKDAYDFDTAVEQKKLALAYALGILDYLGITTVKDELAAAKRVLSEKAGLADQTIEYLQAYTWGDDLIKKLAKAMK